VAEARGDEKRGGRGASDVHHTDAPDGRTSLVEADQSPRVHGVRHVEAELCESGVERVDGVPVDWLCCLWNLKRRANADRAVGSASRLLVDGDRFFSSERRAGTPLRDLLRRAEESLASSRDEPSAVTQEPQCECRENAQRRSSLDSRPRGACRPRDERFGSWQAHAVPGFTWPPGRATSADGQGSRFRGLFFCRAPCPRQRPLVLRTGASG